MLRRSVWTLLGIFLLGALLPPCLPAASFPDRDIMLVVPWAAASPTVQSPLPVPGLAGLRSPGGSGQRRLKLCGKLHPASSDLIPGRGNGSDKVLRRDLLRCHEGRILRRTIDPVNRIRRDPPEPITSY